MPTNHANPRITSYLLVILIVNVECVPVFSFQFHFAITPALSGADVLLAALDESDPRF